MKKVEQISSCPYTSPRGKRRAMKYLKKQVHRARRRAEKRDPANAPRRLRGYTWGWS